MIFKVLIACYNEWDTSSEIPYLLKKANCQVDIFCSSASWLLSSHYYDRWHESPKPLNLYIQELTDLVKKNEYNWVILADDPLIKHLNENIDEEMFTRIMPITKIQNRSILSSKKGFSEFCKAHEIDTPGFVIYNNKEDLQKVRKTLSFPVINKLDFSWGGTNMFISQSYEEFVSNLHKIPENENTLIQEYLEAEEIRTDSLFYKGELVTYFNGKVLEHAQNRFSYTTRRVYTQDEYLKKELIDIGRKIGLNGFANITFLIDREKDRKYLIEVDPRPNSWMALSNNLSSEDFTHGVKKIISGDYARGYEKMNLIKDKIELALFYKDIRRVLWKKDIKGLSRWIFNSNNYWKFIPLYDRKLMKRILKEVWNEVFMFYIRKWTGRKK